MRTTAGDSCKGRRIVVLLPDGRAKIRAEGFAKGWAKGWPEGFAEGFAEGWAKGWAKGWAEVDPDLERMQSAWLSWNARRLDHENRGEPFDDPPPMPIDGYRNGKSDDGGNGKGDDASE